MIQANDPTLNSWLEVPAGSDFPIQNLPFGIYSKNGGTKNVATIIGDTVIDIAALAEAGWMDGCLDDLSVFSSDTLNLFMEQGKAGTRAVRACLSELFREGSALSEKGEVNGLHNVNDVQLHLPISIGDYTDFYSSREHATNVGTMFRDPANALLPNWLHIPVGYHGRASSVIESGVPIHRPKGQTRPNDEEPPVFGPTKLLDFELEMGFFTYPGKPLGDSISTAEAEDYIFGMVVFNDWSARDIQKWEYVPLGPFLAKNFASHVSPWVVTLDALDPFRVAGPTQEPAVLPYLEYEGAKSYDIHLQAAIVPESGKEKVVCNTNFKHMYWAMAQQLAHHSVNGCNIRGGDLLASGTISGPTPDSYGSMLEISWRGSKPVAMPDGSERKFIMDGDTVIMRGHCEKNGVRIGFGEVSAKVLPAK